MQIRRLEGPEYSRGRGESQIPGGSGIVTKRVLDNFELPSAWIPRMQSGLGPLDPADAEEYEGPASDAGGPAARSCCR